jgi:glycosyltransferase involved in cell wall biosynthesis
VLDNAQHAESDAARPELSVVLPAFNEREGLRAAVEAYLRELPACGIDYFELIVINDASTDGTGSMADELAAKEPRLRVLHHRVNQGQVAAILHGFEAARGRFVTHNGVDLPFHPRDTAAMLALLRDGIDVVVVERANRSAYGWIRTILSWGNVVVLRLLFRSPFRDHNFVQFLRTDVARALRVRSRGVSTVTPELILRALRAGYRVVSRPADYHERRTGGSTVRFRAVAYTIAQTAWLAWLYHIHRDDLATPRACTKRMSDHLPRRFLPETVLPRQGTELDHESG